MIPRDVPMLPATAFLIQLKLEVFFSLSFSKGAFRALAFCLTARRVLVSEEVQPVIETRFTTVLEHDLYVDVKLTPRAG